VSTFLEAPGEGGAKEPLLPCEGRPRAIHMRDPKVSIKNSQGKMVGRLCSRVVMESMQNGLIKTSLAAEVRDGDTWCHVRSPAISCHRIVQDAPEEIGFLLRPVLIPNI
jgi:hypothetical protein